MAATGKLRRVSELKRQDYGEELDYSVRRIPGKPWGKEMCWVPFCLGTRD